MCTLDSSLTVISSLKNEDTKQQQIGIKETNAARGRPENHPNSNEVEVFRLCLQDLERNIGKWFENDDTPKVLGFNQKERMMDNLIKLDLQVQARVDDNRSSHVTGLCGDPGYEEMNQLEKLYITELRPKCKRIKDMYEEAEKHSEKARQLIDHIITENIMLGDICEWNGEKNEFLQFWFNFTKIYFTSVLKEEPEYLKMILLEKVKQNNTAKRMVENAKDLREAIIRLEASFGNMKDYGKTLVQSLKDLKSTRSDLKLERDNIFQTLSNRSCQGSN